MTTKNKKSPLAGDNGNGQETMGDAVTFALALYDSEFSGNRQPVLAQYAPRTHSRHKELAEAARAVDNAQDDDEWIAAYENWADVYREVQEAGQRRLGQDTLRKVANLAQDLGFFYVDKACLFVDAETDVFGYWFGRAVLLFGIQENLLGMVDDGRT